MSYDLGNDFRVGRHDSGLLVLVSFISPFAAERHLARDSWNASPPGVWKKGCGAAE